MTTSASDFFDRERPPPKLGTDLAEAAAFISRHAQAGRRIVLVTSGGTTVPLEHNVVRFLDNFSAGTRGSASAEYFLRSGQYAVIFLHRQHSLQPFSRHYSHTTNPFLDLLDLSPPEPPDPSALSGGGGAQGPLFPAPSAFRPGSSSSADGGGEAFGGDGEIVLAPAQKRPLVSLLRAYKHVRSLDLLHSIPFVTVHDYLFLLRGLATTIGTNPDIGRRACFYLACAVSDFFIPQQRMSEHKIQSGKGSLVLEMDQVPKILRPLVEQWSSESLIVSFKLETDLDLLIPKARAALERYGHQVVIGNDLNRRKLEVVFVTPTDEEWVRLPPGDGDGDGEAAGELEIEQIIVDRLIAMHSAHIAGEGPSKGRGSDRQVYMGNGQSAE